MLFLQVAAQNAALLYFAQSMSSISLPEKGIGLALWMKNRVSRAAAGGGRWCCIIKMVMVAAQIYVKYIFCHP